MGSCNFKTQRPSGKDTPEPPLRSYSGRSSSRWSCVCHIFELIDRDMKRETNEMAGFVEALSSRSHWRTKFMMIKDNTLMYGCPESRMCTGLVLLTDADVSKKSSVEFVVAANCIRYTFRCGDEATCDRWIAALKSAAMYSISDKYELLEKLGEGTCSHVYKARIIETGGLCAIKIFDKMNANIKRGSLRNEVNTMRRCHNDKIIEFFDVIEDDTKVYIVTELAMGKELFEFTQTDFLTETQSKKIVRSVLEALQYLHSINVIHGDLKPQNLVYDKETESIKLVDLGSSKIFSTEETCRLSPNDSFTLMYLAPEMINSDSHGPGIDLWSVGVTTYALLCGQLPFCGESDIELCDNITNINFDFSPQSFQTVSSQAKEFISSLLCEKASRLTTDQALEHSWFTTGEEH